MATLVLGAVGSLIGGPAVGAVGALIGRQIDGRLLAPKGRQGPRLGDLAVQTSSYGSQIPKIFGTMRVAGTVIWATGLKENKNKQGGGKGRPAATAYSYSASFAVAVSGRAVAVVRRIWADGKLLRGAAGDFKTETKYRLHRGSEEQKPDPLIAAAEGIASTPAFRGTAYAVFEDFQLGDYGNRIPSLTFEVVAEEGGTATGTIIRGISNGAIAAAPGLKLTGFAAHGDSVRGVVAVLGEAVPAPLYDDGETLRLGVAESAATRIDPALAVARSANEATRVAARQVPSVVTVGYYDPARDYQAGLQRADHGTHGESGRRVAAIALPAALEAGAAKAAAMAKLDHLWRTRERRSMSLPWSAMAVRPGELVLIGEETRTWLVSGWTLEKMAVRLDLVAHSPGSPVSASAAPGRAAHAEDLVHGPTTLHVFDAPALGDALEAGPRMLVAASGASAGWRGAAIEISSGGGGWQAAGSTAPVAVMGIATGVLEAAGSTLFDERHSVEIELLNTDMWLESRDDDALVAGDNLAMIGDELIQFGRADPMGAGRFRLSRLLRGRRGSEWAAASHAAGDPFTLIEAGSLVGVPVPLAAMGGTIVVAARGIGDGDEPPIAAQLAGIEAVRPPSPVHLRAARSADGSVAVTWVRRSRAGWAWIDGVDAPLGEAAEAYRVTVTGGSGARTAEVAIAGFVYTAGEQQADGVGPLTTLTLEVVQIGSIALSRAARIVLTNGV